MALVLAIGFVVAFGMAVAAQPTITINNPASGALFKAGDVFTLSADVSDTGGIQTGSIEADLSQVTGNGGDTSVAPDSVTGTSTDKTATWSVTVGSVSSGNKTMTVSAQDASSTPNSADRTIEVDNTAPTPVITSTESSPTNASPIPVTVDFGEVVTGFTSGDLTIGNGSVGSFTDDGGGQFSVDITPTSDGAVTVDINAGVAQDEAGNANDAALQFSIQSDRTAPTVDITRNSPTSPTNTGSVTFDLSFSESVSNIDTGDFTLSTTNTANGTIGSPSASSGTDITLTINSVTGDGNLGLDISGATDIQDDAGNVLNATPTTDEVFVIDNTAPSISFDSPDPTGDDFVNASEEGGVSVDGSSNDLNGISSVTLEITDTASGSVSPVVSGTTDWSATANVSSLAEGQITYTATATDNAGNTSTANETDTHDSVAPSVSVNADPTGDDFVNASEDNSVTVTGTASDATSGLETVTVTTTGGGSVGPTSTDNAANWTTTSGIDVSSLQEGTITYTATATDAAGNSNTASGTDTHDSVAPSVSIDANPTGDNFVNATEDDAVNVTGSVNDTTSGVSSVTVSAGASGPNTANVSGSTFNLSGSELNVSGEPEGSLTYTATAMDNAGNTSTANESDIHDSVVPSASVNANPTGDNYVNAAEEGSVVVTGTASDTTSGLATVTVQTTGGFALSTSTDNANNWTSSSIDVSPFNEGQITYRANATDNAGNTFTSNGEDDIHDSVAPNVDVGNNPTGDDFINASEEGGFTVNGTSSDIRSGIASVTLEISDGTSTVNPSVSGTTSWSATSVDVSGLAEGSITYTATATDGAGNSNTASETDTHDSVAPSVSVNADPTGDDYVNLAEEGSVTVTGTTSDATSDVDTVTVTTTGGGTVGPISTDNAGSWTSSSFDVSSLNEGTITYTATATDNAGNTNTANESDIHDSVVPSASVNANPTGDNYVNAAEEGSVVVTGTASDTTSGLATVTVQTTGGFALSTSTDNANNWTSSSIDVSPFNEGQITYRANATDNAGNTFTSNGEDDIHDSVAPTYGNPEHTNATCHPADRCDALPEDIQSGTWVKAVSGNLPVSTFDYPVFDNLSGIDSCTTTNTKNVTTTPSGTDATVSYEMAAGDGAKTATIECTDVAGNTSNDSAPSVTVDDTAPTIQDPDHANTTCHPSANCDAPPEIVQAGVFVKAQTQASPSVPKSTFQYDVADNTGGSGLPTGPCTLSGTQQDGSPYTPGDDFNVASGNGPKTFSVTCEDNLQNSSSDTSPSVTVDDTPPSMDAKHTNTTCYPSSRCDAIEDIQADTYVKSQTDPVSGTLLSTFRYDVSDNSGGSGLPGTDPCTLDSGTQQNGGYTPGTDFNIDGPDGPDTFSITCDDNLGNQSSSTSPTLIVDDTAPVDSKSIPGSPTHPSGCDGSGSDCYLTSDTTLRINVSDPAAGSESGSGVDACTVSASGQNYGGSFGFSTPPCGAGNNDFTLPSTLPDDRYLIAVSMVDNIGNESISPDPSQLDVILDNTPPTITTPIHTNDTCWPLDRCDATPEAVLNNTWVKALDQAAFTPNNPLLPSYPSVPRSSFAFPEAGSSVDSTPIEDPDIAPGLPGSGLQDCTLGGTQQDGVYAPGFGTIAFNIAIGDGASPFTLGCRDNLDNDNSLSRTVNVDDTPSSASFNTSGALYVRPDDGVIFVESRTTIIPILSDAGVGVDLNGYTGSPTDGPQGSPACEQNIDQDSGRVQPCLTNFTFPPPDQDHAFWIMRPDKLGNVTEQRFPFVVDDTAPEITIDQPTEQAQYVLNAEVLAQWEVTDDISFFNDGKDSPFNPGLDKSGSGIRDLIATTQSGEPIDTDNVGAQAFNILAIDNLGHQNSVTITYQVVYDFEPTEAFATRLDDGPFALDETIEIGFRLEDASGVLQTGAQPQVKLFTAPDEGEAEEIGLDEEPALAQLSDEGDRYAYDLSTAGLEPGTYQIRIEPGDGTTRTLEFTLEE